MWYIFGSFVSIIFVYRYLLVWISLIFFFLYDCWLIIISELLWLNVNKILCLLYFVYVVVFEGKLNVIYVLYGRLYYYFKR